MGSWGHRRRPPVAFDRTGDGLADVGWCLALMVARMPRLVAPVER